MKSALINISGHPLNIEAKTKLEEDYDYLQEIFFKLIDFSEDLDGQFKEITKQIDIPLDGTVSITLILPSHSTFASLLMVYLSGLLGRMPNLCLLQPDEGGAYFPSQTFTINCDKLKFAGRVFRQSVIKAC
ncbi:hypothetical protein GGQ74_001536 [Desulfobaculum xiamenense]|uniref:Uncharacterized protein n=1 Tax=Desulfobaculum xiamenense TaxID=995050 RepID=A0A846QGG4_9BACT|nr:hypothetical protein [Desulfobaculum xiamenense]NJB67896.1 hypothetical protein [Desulfobaculum xiamenense]